MRNIQKLKRYFQVAQNMGARYMIYRLQHELEKRTGQLKKRHPTNPPLKEIISLDAWKKDTPRFLFGTRDSVVFHKDKSDELENKLGKIISGHTQFFFNEWMDLGKDYDWVTHPITGFKFDTTLHWSQIEDFSANQGDIKYVWEKSRFTFLLDIIRYDHHCESDHSQFVFTQIECWIDKNPVNQGPNWKCSQETSLRIFNWTFALNFYKDSSALTPTLWNKIIHVIYWSLHHVFHHIDFSRIAVRNNHAITETLFLALSELLFPFIPETVEWSKKGRVWFEKEIAYQVYDDGTFLQFSMNYHRVLVQLFTLGISISERNGKPFKKEVYEKAYQSLLFLTSCQDHKTGFLPNYGANDGALFFPLSTQHFRDYRPQLNALHGLLTGELLYGEFAREEFDWVSPIIRKPQFSFQPIQLKDGLFSFKNGGYYVIRDADTLTFIRCGSHKDRPQQADNLHLDIWVSGTNILSDSGTYKYNCEPAFKENFEGTIGHNTVTIEKKSQMMKGSRFIWFFWTQGIDATLAETDDEWEFEGKISAFRYLFGNCEHVRVVKKKKGIPNWEVIDELIHVPSEVSAYQVWNSRNFNEINLKVDSEYSSYNNPLSKEKGYFSEKYGEYTEIERVYLPLHSSKIHTSLVYKP